MRQARTENDDDSKSVTKLNPILVRIIEIIDARVRRYPPVVSACSIGKSKIFVVAPDCEFEDWEVNIDDEPDNDTNRCRVQQRLTRVMYRASRIRRTSTPTVLFTKPPPSPGVYRF